MLSIFLENASSYFPPATETGKPVGNGAATPANQTIEACGDEKRQYVEGACTITAGVTLMMFAGARVCVVDCYVSTGVRWWKRVSSVPFCGAPMSPYVVVVILRVSHRSQVARWWNRKGRYLLGEKYIMNEGRRKNGGCILAPSTRRMGGPEC